MTQESLSGIESGASVASVRVQSGAAVADFTMRKGIIVDRDSALAAPDARAYIVEDDQVGNKVMTLAFENIDKEAGEATLAISEKSPASLPLLQAVTQCAMHEAGVRETRLDRKVSNVPVEQLQSIGFHAIDGTQAEPQALTFVA
jgi:hypothetical protein